jgi:DNA invertase Pin-like site-specific DNA recombinase
MSAALAENERDVIREHPISGLASARARGRKGGRPVKLTPKQVCTARKMLAHPEMTIKEVAEAFGVNQATIYRSALTATQREPRTRCVMKILF